MIYIARVMYQPIPTPPIIRPRVTKTAVLIMLKIIFLKNPVFVTENSDEIITASESTTTSAILITGISTVPISRLPLIKPLISVTRLMLSYIGRHIDARGVKKITSRAIRSGDATELERRIPKK